MYRLAAVKYIQPQPNVFIRVCTRVYTYACVCLCMFVYTDCLFMHVCVYTLSAVMYTSHPNSCVRICVSVCVCVCIPARVIVCVHVCVQIDSSKVLWGGYDQ